MNTKNLLLSFLGLSAIFMMPACTDSEGVNTAWPTALVTVSPDANGSFLMYLDDANVLIPNNVTKSPFGDKEVRALVNYTMIGEAELDGLETSKKFYNVNVAWIDSIRTKKPVPTLGIEDDDTYGNDPIKIINDWVTVAEDGYLTLRIRTRWGGPGSVHYLNLVSGTNPDSPLEFELRHNAKGDVHGEWGDAMVAFNLNDVLIKPSAITLKWLSFDGPKSAEFKLSPRFPKDIYAAEVENLHSVE